ncbi:hypothetical protein J4411_00950 [Candidatus Pacearchaeota archaeon]|nr:hypothetical protein [Candidatus Pacearchaeota archaeon]
MKNKIILAFGILILGVLLMGLGSAADMCPLNLGDYDQIVNIGGGKLRSDLTILDAKSSMVPLVLNPGDYSITLVARDESLNRKDDSQPNEQYQISFLKEGSQVALTSSTSDLEDNVLFSEVIEVVETRLSLPEGVDSIQAIHSEYNSVPTDSPNSLYAVCVGINKVEKFCDYDAGVNYAYSFSNGTGIAIGHETGSNWIEGYVNLSKNETYDIKLSLKNFGASAISNLYILFEIDGSYLNSFYKNLAVSSSAVYQKFELNASSLSCGSHIISAELSKEGQIDCNLENNYAEREIYVQCNGIEPPNPTCGDNVCGLEESCLTCFEDCGFCDTEDDDNDGNTNHSFISFSYGCSPEWQCSSWGDCINRIQTRMCNDKNNCNYTYGKPLETSGCVEGITSLNSQIQDGGISLWILIGIIFLVILLVILILVFL